MAVAVWDTLGPARRALPQVPLTQPAVAQGLLRSDGNSGILDVFSS